MQGSSEVQVIGCTQPEDPPEGLIIFSRNVDRRQVAAPLEVSKHDSIETIGLEVVARLPGDE